MLIDRRSFAKHRRWAVFALVASLAATAWFLAASRGMPGWPGGASFPGLTFGFAGGALILFEFALWGRKKLRSWRIGRAQTWMIMHIWLGLLTVPLLVLHSGFRWGGSLSTVLMLLFLAVIVSGVWGLALQQVLPRRMLEQVPAETIYSQIDRMVKFMGEDARRLVAATCGPFPGEDPDEADPDEGGQGVPNSHLTVGAVQTVGEVQGKVLSTRFHGAAVPGSEPLREMFRSSIAPFLLRGERSRSPLARPGKAAAIFGDLRKKLPVGSHEAVLALENLCEQRRQLDRQVRLHRLLHGWLAVHLPLSISLVFLMFVHVWVALKYR